MEDKLTLRASKIRITKLKNILWSCYAHLQEIYGTDGEDFLTGNVFGLNIFSRNERGEELKVKIRKLFERERNR